MAVRVQIPGFLVAVLVALLAQPAAASLDRYRIRNFSISDFQASSPKTFIIQGAPEPGDGITAPSTAVVDRTGPTLRRLLFMGDLATTTHVSTFNGFIWFVLDFRDGPQGAFTATSSTLDTGTNVGTVSWPALTGYAITGRTFCNANPSFICTLAVGSHLATVEPDLRSSFYDVGPWEFHGTGFRGPTPFVFFTSTLPGNVSVLLKGVTTPNATVPALPLLGVAALSVSLVALGVAVLRRHRA